TISCWLRSPVRVKVKTPGPLRPSRVSGGVAWTVTVVPTGSSGPPPLSGPCGPAGSADTAGGAAPLGGETGLAALAVGAGVRPEAASKDRAAAPSGPSGAAAGGA